MQSKNTTNRTNMNPITKLLREQKHELAGIILGNEILGAVLGENSLEKLVGDWHTTAQQQLIDVIIEELESRIENPGGKMDGAWVYFYGIKSLLEEAQKNV